MMVVELQFGEKISEERLRENLPIDIIEKKLFRIQQSPWVQCPTCKCGCNRYYQPPAVAGKTVSKV